VASLLGLGLEGDERLRLGGEPTLAILGERQVTRADHAPGLGLCAHLTFGALVGLSRTVLRLAAMLLSSSGHTDSANG